MLLGTVAVQPVRAQTFLKYEIDLWYTPSHYGNTEQDVAELLKAQLEATGYFDVTIQSAEWGTYLDQLGTMPLFLLGWWFDYPDPSNYIDPFVGAGAFSLGSNYSSTVMDGYITQMLTNTSATHGPMHKKMHRGSSPLIAPLFHYLLCLSSLPRTNRT
jgi:ABC-type oligopeptide transport system substrate-binding subunit